MNPEKNPLPVETSLVSRIVAAVKDWQAQMPAAATLVQCEAGAQQLAQHLAQLALTEQLAARQAAAGAQLAYDEYRAADLPMGSGAIEGTCKHLVAARCNQAGMRWTAAGIDALLALRRTVLNEQLDTLLPPPKLKLVWH
jgi:hypothetical protein